jgi:RNA polymerase sigma factor for flagellar operon FliA
MFTDSYDVVLCASPKEILQKFRSFQSEIVFSTENLLPADLSADPLEKFASKQFLGQVVEILKDLPENQKMVVALHYQEDLSYREIAAVMDLTPGRISQLHTQAMISIRAMLGA